MHSRNINVETNIAQSHTKQMHVQMHVHTRTMGKCYDFAEIHAQLQISNFSLLHYSA